jgi:type III secretory pathway component EscV
MEAKRLQRWWIVACAVALLLATWAGGFSLVATFIFGVIYLTGATMIGRDDDADDAEDTEDVEDAEHAEETEQAEETGPTEATETDAAEADNADAEP